MPVFAKTKRSKGVKAFKHRHLHGCILSYKVRVIITIFLFFLHNNIYSQNPFLHFAFNVGGAGGDNGESVVADHLGNIYTTGYFGGTADFDPGPGVANLTASGTTNIYVAKYTAGGSYQWAFSIPSSAGYGAGNSIFVDAAGNLYVTGTFLGDADFDPGPGVATLTSNGSTDFFVAKYNTAGVYQWAFNIGGVDPDYAYSVAADAAGNVFVTGSFQGAVDFDPGAGTANITSIGIQDAFLAKYNAAGVYQWAFNLGTSFASNRGASVAVDGSSNVYVTGTFYAAVDFDPGPGTAILTAQSNDLFLAKYSSSGAYQWAFNVGGATSDVGYDVAIDMSGNVYLSGYFQGPADFDPGPGGAIVIGAGAFLAKYNAAGQYQWVIPILNTGGGNINIGISIAFDVAGNIYLTGHFSNTADFNPGAATNNLTATGQSDIFVAKYSAVGNYFWAFDVGGTGTSTNVGSSIAVDDAGGIFVTGNFLGTADFDPNAGVTNLSSNANSSDIFLAKYSPCPFLAGPGPIAGNTSVCGGSPNTYSITPIVGALSYTWTLPSGWTGTSTTSTINTTAGNNGGVISVTVNYPCGPSTSQSLTVTANPVLTASVVLFANPTGTICAGKSMKFTARSIGTTPAINYDFKVNGVSQQSGIDTTYTTVPADGDAVTCTITATGACLVSPNATSNTIIASVASFTPTVNLVASNPGPVCEGTPIQFSATASNLGSSTVINYDFKINGAINQSGSATVFNPGTLYAGVNSISASIRVVGGTCMTTNVGNSNIIPINVDAIPVISFNPPSQTIILGSSTPLNANVSVTGGTYLWTPSTGLSDPTALNPMASPTVNTTFNLHVVTNAGCVADKTTTIKVFNEVYIPNAFVPNGNALNRVFKIPSGTNLKLDHFDIFNRFGNKVFSTSDINEGWDGTYKGTAAMQGTYVYVIKGTDFRGDFFLKGTVLLIR